MSARQFPVVLSAPSGAGALREGLSPARLAALLAGRFAALQRIFSAHGQWSRLKLAVRSAGNAARNTALRVLARLPLRAIIWRRIFILALAGLLIIAAGLAWEWSLRGLPSDTDACRWLAEPPAPYLAVEAR